MEVGPLLDDLARDGAQFEALLGTLRVLLASGQAGEARALTEHVSAAIGRRLPDRRARARGPCTPACAKLLQNCCP